MRKRVGFVCLGVKNRSQADIKAGKTVQACLEDEKQYFRGHPVYGHMGPQYFGIPSLVDKLTRVLFLHIKHVLPEIRQEIQTKSRSVQTRIHELGEVGGLLTHTLTVRIVLYIRIETS